jgi:hypothetical protein
MKLLKGLKKLVISVVLATPLLNSFALPANASANFQYKDGVFGEIKYVRACNQGWGSYLKITSEAGSGDRQVRARVTNVDFKIYSSQKFTSNNTNYTNNPNWRPLSSHTNTYPNDRRWYTIETRSPLTWFNPDFEVKVSQHVWRQDWGTKYPSIDLGGVINLGNIPYNQCRTYDDGRYSNN